MDKVYMKESDFVKIYEWQNKNPSCRLVANEVPLSAFVLDTGDYNCKYIKDGNKVTLICHYGKIKLCKATAFISNPFADVLFSGVAEPPTIYCLSTPMVVKVIPYAGDKSRKDEYQELATMLFKQYILLMTYMVFGHNDKHHEVRASQERSQHQYRGKHNKKSITYVFQNRDYVAKGGHHASPGYEFSVRGHYRTYKNGKKIWIAQYQKGVGKHKSKRYKIGGNEND